MKDCSMFGKYVYSELKFTLRSWYSPCISHLLATWGAPVMVSPKCHRPLQCLNSGQSEIGRNIYLKQMALSCIICLFITGSFEESVLNGRLEPVSTVQGFTADLGASGSFCPRHLVLPVTVFFYTLGDNDKVSTPYLVSLQ